MAFKKAPEQDTYSTVEFPFVKEISSRDYTTDKDVDYLNVVVDPIVNKLTGEKGFQITKRDGTTTIWTGSALEKILAWIVWFNDLVFVTSNGDLKSIDLDAGANWGVVTTRQTNMWGVAPTYAGLVKYKNSSGTMYLLATNLTVIKQISTSYAVSATINDADLPPHFPTLVVMDGYLFVMNINTGAIHNSNLNNIATWTAGDFITADQYTYTSGAGIYLINNMIAAMTDSGIEYFYNAGIATGSPLQRNQSLATRISLIDSGSLFYPVVQQGDNLIFIGADKLDQQLGGLAVFVAGPGRVEKIDLQVLNQDLIEVNSSTFTNSFLRLTNGIHPGTATPLIFISVFQPTASTWNIYTLDLTTRLLTRWFFNSNTEYIGLSGTFTTTYHRALTFIVLDTFSTNVSKVILLDPSKTQDNGSNFAFSIRTDLEDFNTINQKFMGRLTLIGDKPSATASVSVSWTDDDYQTFNTPISVDMYQDLPSITRLGKFRRRAFKIEGTHAYSFSLKRIEVDINKGNT